MGPDRLFEGPFPMASKNLKVALLIAVASVGLASTQTASAQEQSNVTSDVTIATHSHFTRFGMSVDRPSVAFSTTYQANEWLSVNGWLRLAPNEDWSGLDPLATEFDATATAVVLDNDLFEASLTGGGYFFPADDLDATVGTAQIAIDTKPMFGVLTFHVEHGEYFGGFREGQSEFSGTLAFPIGGDFAVDLTLGGSELRELRDDVAFGELGLSHDGWRVWLEAFQGENDEGGRLAFKWQLR